MCLYHFGIPMSYKEEIMSSSEKHINHTYAKPFIKWAGGKKNLLPEIKKRYPFEKNTSFSYVEPFVGGAAVGFDVLSSYDVSRSCFLDINAELVNTYWEVRDNVHELIYELSKMEKDYLPLNNEERQLYYTKVRDRYNTLKQIENPTWRHSNEKAVLFIFLNKTCFNGLYRVNKQGLFNVPMGAYKKPKICDEQILIRASQIMKNADTWIKAKDYTYCENFVDSNTFVYIDPPYRPLNKTSNFTNYTAQSFNDDDQIKLAEFVRKLDKRGAKILVSAANPKNIDEKDDFMDNLYKGFTIERVSANRSINCKGNGRGSISELLIRNY